MVQDEPAHRSDACASHLPRLSLRPSPRVLAALLTPAVSLAISNLLQGTCWAASQETHTTWCRPFFMPSVVQSPGSPSAAAAVHMSQLFVSRHSALTVAPHLGVTYAGHLRRRFRPISESFCSVTHPACFRSTRTNWLRLIDCCIPSTDIANFTFHARMYSAL